MANPRNTNVLLSVNTQSINQQNKKNMVVFSDDRSDPAENPGHPETYVSTVNRNMRVSWSGLTSSPNSTDTVSITDVSKKTNGGGSDILQDTSFGDPNGDGIVTGQVKDEDVTGDENYNITFIINGNTTDPFTIDPKLQMATT